MSINTFKTTLRQQLQAGGSETTIYLNSITTVTGEEIEMNDFLPITRGIITVDPENDTTSSSRPEFISFTGIDAATKTLTGCTRGLSAKSNAEITANKTFHPVDSPVIISFGAHNIQDFIDYIDAEVGALTVGTNVINITGTAGETISSGNLIYLKESDGRWWKCDADTEATIYGVQLGIAQGAGTAGNAITDGVVVKGRCSNFTGLTANTRYYASNTAGGISTTAGTVSRVIGYAISTTALNFDPEYETENVIKSSNFTDSSAGAGDSGKVPKLNASGILDTTFLNPQSNPTVITINYASSPYTWTKDLGLKYIEVEAWGGGGNGGASNATGSIASGGGGGGYIKHRFYTSELGATETVTIGGSGGGDTTFGTLLTAEGGDNGAGYTSGNASNARGGGYTVNSKSTTSFPEVGNQEAVTVGAEGTILYPYFKNGIRGGGSGGGASGAGAGGTSVWGGGGGGGSNSAAGAGGVSVYGGNGGAGATNATATAGSVPGGGGGGAEGPSGGSAVGGAGGVGRCVITEYYA